MKQEPITWIKTKLGLIGHWGSGGTPLRSVSNYYEGNIPWLNISDLNDSFIFQSERFISQEGLENSSAKLLFPNTLLIAMYGSVGKLGITKISCTTNQAIAFCVPYKQAVDLFFLFYFLMHNKPKFVSLAKGGTQQNISQTVIKAFPISIPPLAEQKRIVKKIEELFAVIDKNIQKLKHAQQALIQYRQSVLNSYLNTHKGNPITLGEIISPRRERVTYNGDNGNIPFIGLDCIVPNALAPFKVDSLKDTKSTCFMFYKNDVLYGRMRSYLNKVFKAEINGAASAEFIVFPSNTQILPDYLKYTLHQQKFVEFATRNSSGNRPRVKFEEDLSTFSLILPSLPEQKAIVEKIEKAFACADKAQAAISAALEQAKQLKQSILKRAFEGRLVPQDPNDKPVDLTQLTPKGKSK